jgi:dipeptide/tripeptide permease
MTKDKEIKRSKFSPLFWLVVVFEFFERGSYYGMMSILSVYMTDELGFSKPDVGLIKGTIQPLLYFLPIISGALADRFGFRKMLMIAFSLLGSGYFLTSQATEYAPVFLALVVMGLGAGAFKPVISGSIARCTDETNSTLGFGIFYWSINLGAFLFPLILVPLLRDNIGYDWVILAAAIGTGAMLIPTIFGYKEPPKPKEDLEKKEKKTSLLQTLANAFEIIYSPFVLLTGWAKRTSSGKAVLIILLVAIGGYGIKQYVQPQEQTISFNTRIYQIDQDRLTFACNRNLSAEKPYKIMMYDKDMLLDIMQQFNLKELPDKYLSDVGLANNKRNVIITLLQPDRLEDYSEKLIDDLRKGVFTNTDNLDKQDLMRYRDECQQKTRLQIYISADIESDFKISEGENGLVKLVLADKETFSRQKESILAALAKNQKTAAIKPTQLEELTDKVGQRSFFVLFVGLLFGFSLLMLRLAPAFQKGDQTAKLGLLLGTTIVLMSIIWFLPDLSIFARILSSIIGFTITALLTIDYSEPERFNDHFKFLLMVVIYSGFWVLYFQMFDSVLWYVQAYVDPTSLNQAINAMLETFGIERQWRFDVEIVTVINAGTIILLQLFISAIVKNTKALPTMIVGICMGTAGMAILAISTGIWIFMLGIVIFSIGEMTAHPKFISYVGQTAPKSRVAMYMGYLFLYGVIGSSVGGVMGANLYVKFVDELNQPRTLWLIFASIGLATIIGLLIYNKFMTKTSSTETIED